MKKSLIILLTFSLGCTSSSKEYRKPEDALDAGREFINSQLQGDYAKAAFYLLSDEKNQQILNEREKFYRQKDREGRQNWRTASINILEVKNQNDTMTCIFYQNSFDKIADTICVIKRSNSWYVDLTEKK
jgi:hypothetical protein